ncbi:LAFA_0C02872g1_1 [Lachancea sp. 'fantastica']|nr:LAFA_0C02872g1_1 [Lachancea sp. 'fantastica']
MADTPVKSIEEGAVASSVPENPEVQDNQPAEMKSVAEEAGQIASETPMSGSAQKEDEKVPSDTGSPVERSEVQKNEVQGSLEAEKTSVSGVLKNPADADDHAVEEEAEAEVEAEVEEEEEGETRCVCGEVDPPDESGLYIQCEQCSVWQHGFCVGITDGEGSAPEKYWCEKCRPELHTLYTNDAGQGRSIYKPVQQSRRQNRRIKKDDEPSSHRSNGPANTGSGKRLSSALEKVDTDIKTETQKSIPAEEQKPRKRQQRRKENTTQEQVIYGRRDSDEDRRSLDRRRATSSAREEKQYQLMLEKALKESRRASQADEELEANLALESNSNDMEQQISAQPPALDVQAAEEPPKKRAKPSINNNNSPPTTSVTSSEDDSRRKPKRGGPRKVRGRNSSRASSNDTSSNTSDIGISKPIKPRLPTQRTSLNEMRRRVGAILEFISRTQLELSDDQIEKHKFTEFIDNQEFVKKVDVVYSNFDDSLKTMDELTRKLLMWEKKYAVNH